VTGQVRNLQARERSLRGDLDRAQASLTVLLAEKEEMKVDLERARR
jgi:hypothetical protein